MTTASLATAHIDDRVLLARILRHHLRLHILHVLYLLALVKGKQGVEEAHHQILVLAEHFLESEVGLRVKIFSILHIVSVFCCRKSNHYFRTDKEIGGKFACG